MHAEQIREHLAPPLRFRRTLRAVVVTDRVVDTATAYRIVYAPGVVWARRIHYHRTEAKTVAAFSFDGQTTMEEVCIALGLHYLAEPIGWTVEDTPGVQEFAGAAES